MTKQEFIIDTLKPYLLDANLCAYENERCVYLTKDGRMCAVGKHLDKSCSQYNTISTCGLSVNSLDYRYVLENILKKSSRNMLSLDEWVLMQTIHDRISDFMDTFDTITRLESVSRTNLDELRQYCKIGASE